MGDVVDFGRREGNQGRARDFALLAVEKEKKEGERRRSLAAPPALLLGLSYLDIAVGNISLGDCRNRSTGDSGNRERERERERESFKAISKLSLTMLLQVVSQQQTPPQLPLPPRAAA